MVILYLTKINLVFIDFELNILKLTKILKAILRILRFIINELLNYFLSIENIVESLFLIRPQSLWSNHLKLKVY